MSFSSLSSDRARVSPPIIACSGIAWWKRRRIRAFFQEAGSLRFFYSSRHALRYAQKARGSVAVWANRVTPALQEEARAKHISLFLLEDGFIRSIGLGSGFLPPCSIILDSQGAYVDPSQPSDLENMLASASISSSLRERTRKLVETLKQFHISKYASATTEPMDIPLPTGRQTILVPGQVAGDLSVIRGGGKITNNLALLQEVRHRNPQALIIYRPHPDVEAGHRRGHLSDAKILAHADIIHRKGSMSTLLEHIDEVHTLTSLTGFEALLRGKAVTTYGAPFYAGWGLTNHLGPQLPRRGRMLDIIDLAAIALILYPLYINPETEKLCEVEELIACFGKTDLWKPTLPMRLRQKQGQIRRYCSRLISSYRTPHA